MDMEPLEMSWENFITILDTEENEELLRWVSGESVLGNATHAPVYPIVAFDPRSMDEPIIVGLVLVSHHYFQLEGTCSIGSMGLFYDVCAWEDLPPCISEYVSYVWEMENGIWPTMSELLLYHNRAAVLDEKAQADGEQMGWKQVVEDSLFGKRSGYTHWADEPQTE